MSKHTPGPWTIKWYTNVFGNRQDIGCEGSIAACGGMDSNRVDCGPESRANARLIAAAPELLDSCKRLYSLVEMLLREMNDPDRDDTCESDMEHAHYVISTAEGD